MKIADDYAAIKQRLSEIEAEKKVAVQTTAEPHPYTSWYKTYEAQRYENEVSTSNVNFLRAGIADSDVNVYALALASGMFGMFANFPRFDDEMLLLQSRDVQDETDQSSSCQNT